MDKKEYLQLIDEVIAKGKYKDNWDSLSEHETPSWFMNSKFGIFIHWGIYSVPAFGNEWYSRNMYIQGSPEFEHHVKTYGKHKEFGYKDFIPMLTAEKFDAENWISLFKEAGAKYVVPVAEHHDGFQMYKSEISKWNAAEMGPKRDVLGELTAEAKKQGLINGASSHRIEHWFFMGHGREFESDITDAEKEGDFYWPAQPEANHYNFNSEPTPDKEFLEDWLVRSCEIIDKYHVRQLYFDWWIQHSSAKPYLKKLAAYYYNRALEWGEEVMITYKHDAFAFGTANIDIECGQFANVVPFYWQSCTSIGESSWGYKTDNTYKSPAKILCKLIDCTSKNGSLLLNVGPKADGTIAEEEVSVLKEIGKWMQINGEGIYNTRSWRFAEEGPTESKDGQFTDQNEKQYTKEDFRFTRKGRFVYAFSLNCPENGELVIKSLADSDACNLPKFLGIIKSVEILGNTENNVKPEWKRDTEGLHIFIKNNKSKLPVCFKIEID